MPPTPSRQCLTRLQREFKTLKDKPEPGFTAAPDPDNILCWVFVFEGPADTLYEGGRYVGELHFPPEYPFKPPDVLMRTPSGRFEVNTPICMSNSSFHPESWSPMWGVSTILTGFISFFVSKESASGSINTSDETKKKFAAQSSTFNASMQQRAYRRTLPEEHGKDVVRADASPDLEAPQKKERVEDAQ